MYSLLSRELSRIVYFIFMSTLIFNRMTFKWIACIASHEPRRLYCVFGINIEIGIGIHFCYCVLVTSYLYERDAIESSSFASSFSPSSASTSNSSDEYLIQCSSVPEFLRTVRMDRPGRTASSDDRDDS